MFTSRGHAEPWFSGKQHKHLSVCHYRIHPMYGNPWMAKSWVVQPKARGPESGPPKAVIWPAGPAQPWPQASWAPNRPEWKSTPPPSQSGRTTPVLKPCVGQAQQQPQPSSLSEICLAAPRVWPLLWKRLDTLGSEPPKQLLSHHFSGLPRQGIAREKGVWPCWVPVILNCQKIL